MISTLQVASTYQQTICTQLPAKQEHWKLRNYCNFRWRIASTTNICSAFCYILTTIPLHNTCAKGRYVNFCFTKCLIFFILLLESACSSIRPEKNCCIIRKCIHLHQGHASGSRIKDHRYMHYASCEHASFIDTSSRHASCIMDTCTYG